MPSILSELSESSSSEVNNLWLSELLEDIEQEIHIDPSTGPQDGIDSNLEERLLSITFEKIRQNIASYPCKTIIDGNSFTKTYYLEKNSDGIQGTIILNTLISIDGNTIIDTISGDTGINNDIKKVTTIGIDDEINTVYTVENIDDISS